jgi:hypothetical protein
MNTFLILIQSLRSTKFAGGLVPLDKDAVFIPFQHDTIDKSEYDQVMNELVHLKQRDASVSSHVKYKLDRLFDILSEKNSNGTNLSIKSSKLFIGLSILCSGSRDKKISTIFRFLDYPKKGFLTQNQFTEYLESIFTVIYEFEKKIIQRIGCSSKKLCAITASHLFNTIPDGKLTFPLLKNWYH